MGAVLATLVLMMTGVLAVPITFAGAHFTIQTDKLDTYITPGQTNGFVQTGDAYVIGATPVPFLNTYIKGGADMGALSQCIPLTGVGKLTITASEANAVGDLNVALTDMTIGAGQTATFNNIRIGLSGMSESLPGPQQPEFQQKADSLNIPAGGPGDQISQKAYFVSEGGTFALKGLAMNLVLGGSTCP